MECKGTGMLMRQGWYGETAWMVWGDRKGVGKQEDIDREDVER